MMIIYLDPAHGIDTLGKRSVDERLLEYSYSREICNEVQKRLIQAGYDVRLTTTSESEPGLTYRANIVNEACSQVGVKNVCLVSIHLNAHGLGKDWTTATGWEAWTSKGQTQGDKLADCLYDAAKQILPKVRPDIPISRLIRTDKTDGDRDKEENFTVLAKSKCAACLTENFFMTNKADVDWLLSSEGKETIIQLHVEGIKRYIAKYSV